jgi:hypothetical protein
MTAPAQPDDSASRRRRRRLALAAVLGLIVVAALLTPELIGGRTGDPRLTTYSAESQGARLVYELGSRLGWHVDRWTSAEDIPADPRTAVALLYPVQPLGAIETHALLDRVRAGGGLLYVMSGGSPLDDSLHLKRIPLGGTYQSTAAGTADAPRRTTPGDTLKARNFGQTTSDTTDDEDTQASECAHAAPNGGGLPMWADENVSLWGLQWVRGKPNDAVIFARSVPPDLRRDTTVRPSSIAAAGFRFGRGRIVVAADPDLLRNDVVRVCHWGLDVVAVRMLEYLAAGEPPRDHLVFDEYHQGYGTHPGTLRAIVFYLARVPSGHVLLQAMLAGLVLLLALGPRPLPAHDAERVERRSPLEHVSALAQAYGRVAGTRLATARLLRGVRRRVERGTRVDRSGGENDARFLDEAASATSLSEDVALVRRGLAEPLSRREFEAVGGALARLEESLLSQRR